MKNAADKKELHKLLGNPRKLKVLRLDLYVRSKNPELEARRVKELNTFHTKIPPVVNRTGLYLQGDKCWFETRGMAFLYPKMYFLYTMELLNASELPKEAIEGLRQVKAFSPSLLSKKQSLSIDLYYMGKALKRSTLRKRRDFKKVRKQISELD